MISMEATVNFIASVDTRCGRILQKDFDLTIEIIDGLIHVMHGGKCDRREMVARVESEIARAQSSPWSGTDENHDELLRVRARLYAYEHMFECKDVGYQNLIELFADQARTDKGREAIMWMITKEAYVSVQWGAYSHYGESQLPKWLPNFPFDTTNAALVHEIARDIRYRRWSMCYELATIFAKWCNQPEIQDYYWRLYWREMYWGGIYIED